MAKPKNNMSDEQFNKGQSKSGRSGKFGKSPSKGGGNMADKQFNQGSSYNDINDDGDASAGKKTPGGMKYSAGQSAAAKIMQAVAKASQSPAGSISKGKPGIKPAKSPAGQAKDYDNSPGDGESVRVKSMNRGFVQSVKKPESALGTKTAGKTKYKGK